MSLQKDSMVGLVGIQFTPWRFTEGRDMRMNTFVVIK